MPESLPIDTRSTPSDVLYSFSQVWRDSTGDEPDRVAVNMLVAHAAHETAEFTRMRNWNFGGVKAPRIPSVGDWVYFTTHEVVSRATADAWIEQATPDAPVEEVREGKDQKGNVIVTVKLSPRHPACRFRSFATIGEGSRFFLRTIRNTWPEAWRAAKTGDVEAYVSGLLPGPGRSYFTGSRIAYQASLARHFSRYMASLAWPPMIVPSLALNTPAEIQTALAKIGYYGGAIDGIAGPKTIEAIKLFQRSANLTDDGIVGPVTRQALRAAVAGK